jgi:hypothetical protein
MPVTGCFLSVHRDFEEAIDDFIAASNSSSTAVLQLVTKHGDPKYSLDNIEAVDMPNNPELKDS